MKGIVDINVNYNLLGYHKQEIFDNKGDLITLRYFREYDEVNDVFSNKAIEENRTYTRDVTTGLLTKRQTTIDWFDESGNNVATKTNVTKYYSAKKGYAKNKRARQNLIDNASMYLLSQVGQTDATAFLRIVKSDINGYVGGDIQPLLDAISSSTETYMTQTIKDTLDVILNVDY